MSEREARCCICDGSGYSGEYYENGDPMPCKECGGEGIVVVEDEVAECVHPTQKVKS